MEPTPSEIPPLVPSLLFLLIITGCAISIGWPDWGGSSWRSHGTDSMTYTTDDGTVRGNIVGDEVQIVVLRNGKLWGIDGMSDSQRKNLRGMKKGGRSNYSAKSSRISTRQPGTVSPPSIGSPTVRTRTSWRDR